MKPRLGILIDFPEEEWPSMDLVSQMLLDQLRARHADRFEATRICPPFQRHFKWVPWAARSGFLRNADRLLNRHHRYPRYARRISGDYDLFHVCDHSYGQLVNALPAERTGVFCHDLDTFRCLLDPGAEPRPTWFRKMAGRALRGLQKAALVFYTTDVVRRQIEHHQLVDPVRLVKVPLGVAVEFTPTAAQADPAARLLISGLNGDPFLLHVGSTIARKRIDVLLATFAGARRSHPNLRLLQIGGEWTADQRAQIEKLGIAPALTQSRGLSRTALAELYRSAAAVLVTSDAEGFGLPVIEALACGASVAASDLPVLREVGGDAVAYIGIADVPRWVDAVGNLLDAPAGDAARDMRVAQAKQYSWEHHGNVIADAYTSLLVGRTPPQAWARRSCHDDGSESARPTAVDTATARVAHPCPDRVREAGSRSAAPAGDRALKHLVYLSPVGVMGGAEQCLLQVMAAVLREEPRAQVSLIAAAEGELIQRAQAIGVKTSVLPMPPQMAELGDSILRRQRGVGGALALGRRALAVLPATWRYRRALGAAVRELEPDLVHSNGLKMHLLASLAKVPADRTVWHLHDFLGARPAMGRALRWASRRAAGAIAISNAVATDARTVLPHLPIQVVYNAIDVSHFCPASAGSSTDGSTLDRMAGLPEAAPGTLRFGMVATFARWKGHDILLQAAAHLANERPGAPFRVYVIGGPIYQTHGSQFSEEELRAQAQKLRIADRTGFIGFQRDPCDLYRALDVVVHASVEPEPLGLTIIEAMACGRPVIVTGAGGAAEIFTPNVDAVGVPPGDSVALARAIGALLDDPQRRAFLSNNARRTAEQRFSRDRLGKEMLSAYRALLRAAVPLPAPRASA